MHNDDLPSLNLVDLPFLMTNSIAQVSFRPFDGFVPAMSDLVLRVSFRSSLSTGMTLQTFHIPP